MLGPGYCGHLMVSLHNITNDVIALPVGSTFVSVSFHYLDTKVTRTSFTTSGHVDKFGDLGIKTTEKTRDYITQDWKSNINGIREKMLDSESYKQHAEHLKKMKRNEYKKYFFKYFSHFSILYHSFHGNIYR